MSLFLCMVLESVLVSFFYTWLISFPSTTCWRDKRQSFLHCIYLPPLSKIRCPEVCGFISGLSTLFHLSTFLSLCQYYTVLITVVCSTVWSQAGWFLQFHSSFSRLPWLFRVFCISLQIVKLFVLVLWKILLVVW